jgi:hypothetical protein
MRVAYLMVAVAAAALICGCGAEKDPRLTLDCNKVVREKQDECYYNKSIASQNTGPCDQIMNEKYKTKCIDDVAFKLMDVLVCKRHAKMPQRDACDRNISALKKVAKAELAMNASNRTVAGTKP